MRLLYSPDDGSGGPAPAALTPAQTPAAPAQAPAPEAAPGPPTWLTQVSPDRRDKKELHKYAKLNDLVDSHIEMESKLSRAIVVPDPEKATPEDIAAFKRGMGIPENPEGYAFDTEKYKGMEKLAEGIRAQAVTAGLTKGQAAKVFDFVASLVKAGTDGQAQARAEQRSTFPARLLESVGNDPKKAEEVKNRLTAFMTRQIGDPALVKEMADSGLLFNPRFAAKMAEISAKMDDAPYIDGKGSAGSKGLGTFGSSYSPDFANQYGGTK